MTTETLTDRDTKAPIFIDTTEWQVKITTVISKGTFVILSNRSGDRWSLIVSENAQHVRKALRESSSGGHLT